MEVSWRGFAVAGAMFACVFAAGCGGDGSNGDPPTGAVRAEDSARAFAPLVELAPGERYRPMSARWFIERSALRFADRPGCEDRTIAVGHELSEQRTLHTDWIAPRALGRGSSTYYRSSVDPDCGTGVDRTSVHADELNRPYDPSPLRFEPLPRAEGFYLDLVDAARTGPGRALDRVSGGGGVKPVPVYVDGRDEGDGAIRLTYWMLYGFHASLGRPVEAHEGDWERVDVLLHDVGDGRYVPRALQLWLGAPDGEARAGALPDGRREVPWSAVTRVDGTHPTLTAAPGTHALSPAGDRGRCQRCERWRTWEAVLLADEQGWYGFGGAWGQPGSTDATTGPLGPRGW